MTVFEHLKAEHSDDGEDWEQSLFEERFDVGSKGQSVDENEWATHNHNWLHTLSAEEADEYGYEVPNHTHDEQFVPEGF